MTSLLFWTLVTNGIVLIITKSKLLSSKREFVKKRYEASFVNSQKPGWIHTWWHSMWTCEMCFGAWVAGAICLFFDTGYPWWAATLAIFFLNWLIFCVENFLFQIGIFLQYLTEDEEFMKDFKKSFKKSLVSRKKI